MKCVICQRPHAVLYYKVPVLQSPWYMNDMLSLENSIGSFVTDVVEVCESCWQRQRGVWRDTRTNELIVRLAP
jgi:hypothetical protein